MTQQVLQVLGRSGLRRRLLTVTHPGAYTALLRTCSQDLSFADTVGVRNNQVGFTAGTVLELMDLWTPSRLWVNALPNTAVGPCCTFVDCLHV